MWLQAYSHDISDPPQSALSGAIASGQIAVIQTNELISGLAGWSGRLADLQRIDRLDRGFRGRIVGNVYEKSYELARFVTDIATTVNAQIDAEVSEILELLQNGLERQSGHV